MLLQLEAIYTWQKNEYNSFILLKKQAQYPHKGRLHTETLTSLRHIDY